MTLPTDKMFLDMMDKLSPVEQKRLLKDAFKTLELIHSGAIDPKAQADKFFQEVNEAIKWAD